LFTSVVHFFIGSLILGEFSVLSTLYILVISPLSDVCSWERCSTILWVVSSI
jgi:hypothetical protein